MPDHPGQAAGQGASAAFDMLHEKVRWWIWRQGWNELRDIQERSIPVLLAGERDLIVAAGTASGKTEAAFLPIVSRLASDGHRPGNGFGAIYISPLRALINDQFRRMEGLCEELEIPVTKWHGDVSASVKARARAKPGGIVLITPESLEAIFVRRGEQAPHLFRALRYIVVDEMHAFLDDPRGKQLQSLLHRIETAGGHPAVRVGLSATLADMTASAAFLRPLDPGRVSILESRDGGRGLKLQLRGYIEPGKAPPTRKGGDEEDGVADREIARHLFKTLRGRRGLVFAGARRSVELYTKMLGEISEAEGVPNEFMAHHGNLSREYREEAERRMKEGDRPATVVCTTTLELGIDIGHIEAVAQVGPGHTVSGMRQRLGRSGRRPGQQSVMRVYTKELGIGPGIHPVDALRTGTVQAIAMLNLMLRRWNEPPMPGRLHLSTLVHQILALIAQHGGLTAKQGWDCLVASGVFAPVTLDLYKAVLRRMGSPEVGLLEQAPDGTLLPGPKGEAVIAARDFYTVFVMPEEYRVVTDRGRSLGTVPLTEAYVPGQVMVLGGRGWIVLEVDPRHREILVTDRRGGNPPKFGGGPSVPSGPVVEEMRRVYEDLSVPTYLDAAAIEFLTKARETFDKHGLRASTVSRHDGDILVFPWCGERDMNGFRLSLASEGIEVEPHGIALSVPGSRESILARALRKLAGGAPPDPVALAGLVPDKANEKFDPWLGDELLAVAYANLKIDTARVPALAATVLAHLTWAEAAGTRGEGKQAPQAEVWAGEGGAAT